VKRSICFILAPGALWSFGSTQVTAEAACFIEGEIDGADFQICLPANDDSHCGRCLTLSGSGIAC
jgi:hypothetical protein